VNWEGLGAIGEIVGAVAVIVTIRARQYPGTALGAEAGRPGAV
jgi:hypothetical protein